VQNAMLLGTSFDAPAGFRIPVERDEWKRSMSIRWVTSQSQCSLRSRRSCHDEATRETSDDCRLSEQMMIVLDQ
jgi:hypothetical protein